MSMHRHPAAPRPLTPAEQFRYDVYMASYRDRLGHDSPLVASASFRNGLRERVIREAAQ